MILFDESVFSGPAVMTFDRLYFDTGGFSIVRATERVAPKTPGKKVRCFMQKVVKNSVVVLWASMYLLAKGLIVAVREVRSDIREVTGEVSLIRSILFLCFGVCAIGYAGVVIALLSR